MQAPFRLTALALLTLATCAARGQTVERVEITGSSIKRIDAETALPVQVLTREDIQRSGATNVEQLMQTVSASTSAGALMASSASGATTGGISSVSLRALTSQRTLVLINGRRLAPYGIGFTNDSVSVDVNSIPLAAIERVEVLKDGASAIYGSDAIAGVINFILRKDYRGGEAELSAGSSSHGDARSGRATLSWGLGNLDSNGFNLVLLASLQKEDSLFGRDRDFASTAYKVDANNDTTSGNTFPANIAAADGSFGSRNPSAASGCVEPYSFIAPRRSPLSCRFNPSPLVSLLPDSRRASLFGALRVRLGGDFEGFVEASYNRNTQRTVIQPVPLSDQFNLPANNPLYNLAPYAVPGGISTSTILLSPSSPYYPASFVTGITGGAQPDLLVRYRAALSGNRDITDTSEAPRLALGARGTAAGWDLDAAVLYSASKVREHNNDGWPILSKLLPVLNSGRVNFFGPNTPAVAAEVRAANFTGDAFFVESSLNSLNARASRDLLDLQGGPLALALGTELRQEHYRFVPSKELSEGDIAGYGGNIAFVDRKRNADALFAELNLPLLKGLEADAAVRFDHYQGVGNATTPKLSLRWQPLNAVLLRGSAGKGFRAPSLADLYSPPTTGVSIQGQTDPLRCPVTNDGTKDCGTQFATLVGGNARLVPEKSKNLSMGLVLEPLPGMSVAVDTFRITLKDTISNGIAPAVILADLGKYGSYVRRGPVDPAYPSLPGPIASIDQRNLNVGQTRVAGTDVDLRWRLGAGDAGRFTLVFTGTYFARFDTENPDGSFSGGVDQVNTTTGGIVPRVKTYQSLTWERKPWSFTLAYNWQKGYTDMPGATFDDPTDPAFRPRRVGAYETLDTHLSYTGLKDIKLALGINNLLDRNPPYTNSGGQTSFQSGYDPQYADPRGRFIYLQASHAFP